MPPYYAFKFKERNALLGFFYDKKYLNIRQGFLLNSNLNHKQEEEMPSNSTSLQLHQTLAVTKILSCNWNFRVREKARQT